MVVGPLVKMFFPQTQYLCAAVHACVRLCVRECLHVISTGKSSAKAAAKGEEKEREGEKKAIFIQIQLQLERQTRLREWKEQREGRGGKDVICLRITRSTGTT